MLKKVLSAVLITIAIIISSQFSDMSKVSAENRYWETFSVKDYYAFTKDGYDYYIWYIKYNGSMYGNSTQVELTGVKKNSNNIETTYFFQEDGTFTNGYRRGLISSDSEAQTLYNVVFSKDFQKLYPRPRD